MINNLDLQPNTTINWWIMGILLFSFHLIHIPAAHQTGADRISHHLPSDGDPPEEDDFEDWLDNSYSFSITLLNDRISPYEGLAHFSRHLPDPLSHGCLAQLAPYEDALPTCLDLLCIAPVLVITDSDSHHNARPSHALWKLVLKMIGLTRFMTFFVITSALLISQTQTTHPLSMRPLTLSFWMGHCIVESGTGDIS